MLQTAGECDELGVEYNTGPQPETGEVGEEEDEEDEEEDEEDNVKVLSVEQEFNFKAFVFRFAVKNVTMPYGVLFNNYLNNSKETNHHGREVPTGQVNVLELLPVMVHPTPVMVSTLLARAAFIWVVVL